MLTKRFITLLCFLLYLCITLWADTGKSLIVESNNGMKVCFLLADSPVLTFSDRFLLVTTTSKSDSFEIDNVKQYYFESIDDNTNIADVRKKADIRVSYTENGNAIVEGISRPAQVRIYSASGYDFSDRVSVSGDKVIVSLSSLQKGVYILNANQLQIKVYKK